MTRPSCLPDPRTPVSVPTGSLHARVRAQPDGRLENTPDAHNPEGFSTFFSETSSGKHVPRSLYIDLEPNVVDEVRTGKYRSLFHPETVRAHWIPARPSLPDGSPRTHAPGPMHARSHRVPMHARHIPTLAHVASHARVYVSAGCIMCASLSCMY